jgi:hypothetical protein
MKDMQESNTTTKTSWRRRYVVAAKVLLDVLEE